MAEQSDTIIEERKELMISPTGDSIAIKRKAHFLKPSVNPVQGPDSELPFLPIPHKPTIPEIEKLPLIVKYRGRRFPQNNWKDWVDSLHSKHQSTWKKAGIYEAILSSRYQILRQNELIFHVADRWRSETNTFLFPWAEATITLEDMMVLGGYSVLGDSISKPLETNDLWEIRDSLTEAHKQLAVPSHCAWMNYFMGSAHKLEHETFLALWLSRHVFPASLYCNIGRNVFPIAIHLARGTRIALAPAVLASIYWDLSLLKQNIDVARCRTDEDKGDRLVLDLWAPFELVQLWIWERFPTLRPTPNLIKDGEPRVARWHKVKKLNIQKVGFVIDSEGDGFQWRPYAAGLENWLPPKLYRDEEELVSIGPDLDEEVASFARCLRVSELVGQKCIEQYLPHRVALQFGMDQDIPDCVPRFNMNGETAWSNYCRPIADKQIYVPARLFESDVTERYLKWWKESLFAQKDVIKHFVRRPRNRRRFARIYPGNVDDSHVSVLPGFPLQCHKVYEKKTIKEAEHTLFGVLSAPNSLENKLPTDVKPFSGSNSQIISPSMADDGAANSVPPGFPPKCHKVEEKKTIQETEHTLFGALGAPNNLENKLATHVKPLSCSHSPIISHSMADDGAANSVPPGFPPKCHKVDEKKTIKEEAEDGALSALNNLENKLAADVKSFSGSNPQITSHSMANDRGRLPGIYAGQVEDYHVSVPPGFPPKCHKVDKKKTIKEEAEHELFGALSAPNNLENKLATDIKPFSGSNSQILSHSMAADGASKKDLLMRQMPKILQSGGSMLESKRNPADATVIEMGRPANAEVHVKDNDGESRSYCKPEIPGLELEGRINRLERLFAELKAARSGLKFVNNPAKEDP